MSAHTPREGHTPDCEFNEQVEWSGGPNPANPDHEWICDSCGVVISAEENAK